MSNAEAPKAATLSLVQAACALALDKKAEDVVILDVEKLTSFADYFVIASAPSERQVSAIAGHIDDTLRKAGARPLGSEGRETGSWVLLDYGDFVVHLFLDTARSYYDLDGFWADAPRETVDEDGGLALVKEIDEGRFSIRAPERAAG